MLPMIAIPAITDLEQETNVPKPTNLLLVELDVAALSKLRGAISAACISGGYESKTVVIEHVDHEFVQTFEPEGLAATSLTDEEHRLGTRLDDLATEATSGVRVDAEMIAVLRKHNFVRVCDTDDDTLELQLDNNKAIFRATYRKRKQTCSSRPIDIDFLFSLAK